MRAVPEVTASGRPESAGESAGANLAVVTLAATQRAGLPQPSSAVLMSPWADLAGTGDSIKTKAGPGDTWNPRHRRWERTTR
jgi:monoterpene epsilon-lactone hydrolase